MVVLRPFRGIRPLPELVTTITCLPYDVMNRSEAKEMAINNPNSFLHIIRSEIDFDDSVNQYDLEVYKKARLNLDKMMSDGLLIEDIQPNFYIYRLIMNDRVQTGIVGCTSIDDYMNDTIKKHEYTRVEKELDRINHFDYCNANTEPVFMTYRSNNKLTNIIEQWIASHDPLYDFVSDDQNRHILWLLDNQAIMNEIIKIFEDTQSIYIADGHHRSTSAVKIGLKRREFHRKYSKEAEFNYFLSVLFPHDDLYIMDYNRVVKDLNGLSPEKFISKLEDNFIVETKDCLFKPSARHTFAMYLNNQWYKLTIKEKAYGSNPIDNLDVSILQNNVLSPILGIDDPRSDNRIEFVGGIRGIEELEMRVNKDMKVAFALYPPSMEDMMTIADMGEVMPPKSTWFEPKLRSGLLIHKL